MYTYAINLWSRIGCFDLGMMEVSTEMCLNLSFLHLISSFWIGLIMLNTKCYSASWLLVDHLIFSVLSFVNP